MNNIDRSNVNLNRTYIYIDPFYVNNFILKILKKKII